MLPAVPICIRLYCCLRLSVPAPQVVFLDREPLALLCAILSCHLNCPGPLASNLQAVLADCGLADFARQQPRAPSAPGQPWEGSSTRAATSATSAPGVAPAASGHAHPGVTLGPCEEAERSAALAELIMRQLVEGHATKKDAQVTEAEAGEEVEAEVEEGVAEGEGTGWGLKVGEGGDQGGGMGRGPCRALPVHLHLHSLAHRPSLPLPSSSSLPGLQWRGGGLSRRGGS